MVSLPGDGGLEAELNEPQAAAVAPRRGAAPRLRRRGQRQDARHHLPHRQPRRARIASPPYRILAVTFTNKAAGEMRARLERLCGAELARDLWVGTFHATCARLLRVHGAAVGVQPNFVIYDDADQKAVVARGAQGARARRAALPAARRARAHPQAEARGPRPRRGRVALVRRRRRAAPLPDLRGAPPRGERRRLRRPHPARRAPARAETPEGDEIRRRFDYVLVDEFQDTNADAVPARARARRRDTGTCASSATTIRASTAGAAPTSATSATSGATFPTPRSSSSSRTTARRAHRGRRARRHRAARTSASRRSSGPANEAGDAVQVVAGARRARRGGASSSAPIRRARARGHRTARDRRLLPRPRPVARPRRGDARRRTSRTRSSAARSSSSAPRSRTCSRTCASSSTRRATSICSASSTCPRAASARRRSSASPRGPRPSGLSVFDALARVDDIGELGAAARKKLLAFRELLETLRASRGRARRASSCERVLSRDGLRGGARRGGHGRERRAPREPRRSSWARCWTTRTRRAPRARSRRSRVPRARHARRATSTRSTGRARRRTARRRRVMLMTVHGAKGLEFERVFLTGMEEEMFPYQGVDPGAARRARRRAAPRLRRHHARATAPRDDAHADAPDLRHDALEPTEPLSRRAAERSRRARDDDRHGR